MSRGQNPSGKSQKQQQEPIVYEIKQSKKFTLLRRAPKGKDLQRQWIDYMKGNEIQIAQMNNDLLILSFDCYKHLLFKDFILLFELNKMNYAWTASNETSFKTLLSQCRSQLITQSLDLQDLMLDDLVFIVSPKEVKLSYICPKNNKYNQLSSMEQQQDYYFKILQGKQGSQKIELSMIIKAAQQFFFHMEIEPNDDKSNISNLQLPLIQRLRMKILLENKTPLLPSITKTIKDIFSLIMKIDGKVTADYIEKYLVEKNLDDVAKQLVYLKNLSQKQNITNEIKITLIYQDDVNMFLNDFREDITEKIQKAHFILNEKSQDYPENITLEQLHQFFTETTVTEQNQYSHVIYQKFNDESNLSIEGSFNELLDCFFNNIVKRYWVFDGIKEQLSSKTKQAIQKQLKKNEELIFKNFQEKQVLSLIISQIIDSLKFNDEFEILRMLLEEKITQITGVFQELTIRPQTFISEQKKAWINQINSNLNFQNDVLVEVLMKLKDNLISNYQQKDKETDCEKILQKKFQTIIEKQLDLLFQDLQMKFEQVSIPDCYFLKDCVTKYDLLKFTNPFVKIETIHQTTKYHNFIDRMRQCWLQYLVFRQQIDEITPFTEQQEAGLTFPFENAKQEILKNSFRDYLLNNLDSAFKIEFQGEKIFDRYKKTILEELRVKIQNQKSRRKIEQFQVIKKKYLNSYIPFEFIEAVVEQIVDQKLQKGCNFEIYEETSDSLESLEIVDILEIKGLDQLRIQEWKYSQERLSLFNCLKHKEPSQWDQQLLPIELEKSRFNFFLKERKQMKLQNAIDQILKAYIQECDLILNTPPALREFKLNEDNKIPIDIAISVDINERLFTISDEFLEQVYQFYEQQIEKDLQKQLE